MADSVDARIGQTVDGRYELMKQLGRGGMGAVYLAEHTGIRKPVALKLLAPRVGASTPGDRARFEREAFATGRLKHPNCVAVTDFGKLDDGTLYLAMEHLEGATLADAIEEAGRFPPARALHITRHILEGLAHAHELGIVHRDLKPQNVMLVEHLGDTDFAKVLDFGLAKLLGDAQAAEGGGKLTAAGITFGTPHYISPEQAFGNPVDHRADLYAVSVMLFEMLAGKVPFDGPDIRAILLQHATRVAPRVHEVEAAAIVPTEVEMLIRQGMAKDPRDRQQTAREYAAAVDECLARLESQPTGRLPTTSPPSDDSLPVSTAASQPAPTDTSAPAPAPAGQPAPVVIAPPAPSGSSETAPLLGTAPSIQTPSTSTQAHSIAPTSPRSRPRWLVPSVIGGVALIATITLVATAGGGESPGRQAAVETPDEVARPSAAPIAKAMLSAAPAPQADNGLADEIERAAAQSSRDAEKALKALRKKHPENASIPFALGRVYMDRPWPTEAIKAFRDAIKLDDAYRSNDIIISSALRLLSSHSARWSASRLLERDIGAPALPAIDAVATEHGNKKIRQRAASIAAKIRAR